MLFYFLFYKYNNKYKIINLINLDKAYPNYLILISKILFILLNINLNLI